MNSFLSLVHWTKYHWNFSFELFKYIPDEKENMKILNLINSDKYYCQINSDFRLFLRKNIINYTKLAEKLQISSNTLSRIVNLENYWINFQNLIDLCKIMKVEKKEIYYSIKFIKTKNSFPLKYSFKNFNTPAFYRIIGHILGDGGIHVIEKGGKYRAFYTNNRIELINSFIEDLISVFGEIKIYTRIKRGKLFEVWLPTTLGFMFYEFMQYQKFGKKRIPTFVYKNKNQKFYCALLQSLYDDEGYIYPQKKMIVISQKSFDLINDIREIVKRTGISPNKLLIHKSKNRSLMNYFTITGKNNILKFADKIGFIHPVKKEKLDRLLKKYR